MLGGDDTGGPCDDGIAGGMYTSRPIRCDPDAAHSVKPFDNPFQVGGRRGFGPFAYPPEPGAAVVVGCDQMFERGFLLGRTVADQVSMSGLARPCPHDKREPFQRRWCRQHDPVCAQAIDHAGDNRLAPVGRGGDLRSQRQHRSHVHSRKGTQTEQGFDFGTVFAQRRGAHGIAGEVVGRAPDLLGEQLEYGVGHRLTHQQPAAGMTQVAKLHRVADPVGPAPTSRHLRQIIGTERVEPFNRRAISGRIEDGSALRGRQNGLGRHRCPVRHETGKRTCSWSIDQKTGYVTG